MVLPALTVLSALSQGSAETPPLRWIGGWLLSTQTWNFDVWI